jgi:hypothetical protein
MVKRKLTDLTLPSRAVCPDALVQVCPPLLSRAAWPTDLSRGPIFRGGRYFEGTDRAFEGARPASPVEIGVVSCASPGPSPDSGITEYDLRRDNGTLFSQKHRVLSAKLNALSVDLCDEHLADDVSIVDDWVNNDDSSSSSSSRFLQGPPVKGS